MFLDCNFHLITQFPKTSFFIFGCFLCQERNKCPVQNKRPPLNYRKFVSPPAAKSNHYGILKSCNIMIHCQCALVYRTTGEQAVDYRSVRIKNNGAHVRVSVSLVNCDKILCTLPPSRKLENNNSVNYNKCHNNQVLRYVVGNEITAFREIKIATAAKNREGG